VPYREFAHHSDRTPDSSETLPSLTDAHADFFDLEEPLSPSDFNSAQRLVLVGTEFDTVTLNTVDFLREHDIDVVCVEYQTFEDEDGEIELLTTSNVRRPLHDEPTGTSGDELTEYRKRQLDFWEGFTDMLSRRDTRLSPQSPQPRQYLANYFGVGGFHMSFNVLFRDERISCQFIIEDDDEFYQDLKSQQEEIEREFSQNRESPEPSLKWIPSEETGGARSVIEAEKTADLSKRENWDEYQDWLIGAGKAIYETFEPKIRDRE
jgi:hypothetical protein